MFLNYKMMFMFTMFMGTMICISSNSWLAMWLGLEMNLLSFIPIMIKNKNILTSEASLKYFLVQAMASSVFLLIIIITMTIHEILLINFFNISNITFIVMNMKLGSAPLHFWFISVMEGLSWMNCYILMTWQKIAPFSIISYLNYNSMFFFVFIVSSIIIGSVGGLNQSSLHKIMAYSSISHLSWLLMAIYLNNSLWFSYFLIYSLISFIVILIFSFTFSHHLLHLVHKLKMSNLIKLILMMNLLSLGGLPPFLGFFPKWLMIQQLMIQNLYFFSLILIFFTLVTLLYYIRISISSFMFYSFQFKWNFCSYSTTNIFLMLISIVSFLGLLVYPLTTFS